VGIGFPHAHNWAQFGTGPNLINESRKVYAPSALTEIILRVEV
jgi:hypothetical protein